MLRFRRSAARLGKDREGATLIEFAMLLPVLLAFSFGIIDMTLFLFEYHRAGEATRQATRTATIVPTMIDVDDLDVGDVATCTSAGGVVSCGAYAAPNGAGFQDILAQMRLLKPDVAETNIRISYMLSDVGDPTTPGGALPLVTLSLINMPHELTMLRSLPLMPDTINLPTFTVTFLGNGKAIATAP